jgi:hypothetical protein
MTIWKNCKADIYYRDDKPDLNDPDYEVRISDDELVVSYQGETGWVNYAGKDLGGGHYDLHSPEVKGHSLLHRVADSNILEGNWTEDGSQGMWRIYLTE